VNIPKGSTFSPLSSGPFLISVFTTEEEASFSPNQRFTFAHRCVAPDCLARSRGPCPLFSPTFPSSSFSISENASPADHSGSGSPWCLVFWGGREAAFHSEGTRALRLLELSLFFSLFLTSPLSLVPLFFPSVLPDRSSCSRAQRSESLRSSE